MRTSGCEANIALIAASRSDPMNVRLHACCAAAAAALLLGILEADAVERSHAAKAEVQREPACATPADPRGRTDADAKAPVREERRACTREER